MQVLLVLLAFLLPLDCLGFSWPRETKEKMAEEVGTSIPEDLGNLGGSDRSSQLLIDVKTVCSMTENSVLYASVLVRQIALVSAIILIYIIRRVADIFA